MPLLVLLVRLFSPGNNRHRGLDLCAVASLGRNIDGAGRLGRLVIHTEQQQQQQHPPNEIAIEGKHPQKKDHEWIMCTKVCLSEEPCCALVSPERQTEKTLSGCTD